jgi:hypothetical protein
MTTSTETHADSADAVNGQAAEGLKQARLIALGRQALLAFWRDLPQLLQEHPRMWVAYHGDVRLGIGPTRFALWQECEHLGLQPEEFMIRSIEPEDPGVVEAFGEIAPLAP